MGGAPRGQKTRGGGVNDEDKVQMRMQMPCCGSRARTARDLGLCGTKDSKLQKLSRPRSASEITWFSHRSMLLFKSNIRLSLCWRRWSNLQTPHNTCEAYLAIKRCFANLAYRRRGLWMQFLQPLDESDFRANQLIKRAIFSRLSESHQAPAACSALLQQDKKGQLRNLLCSQSGIFLICRGSYNRYQSIYGLPKTPEHSFRLGERRICSPSSIHLLRYICDIPHLDLGVFISLIQPVGSLSSYYFQRHLNGTCRQFCPERDIHKNTLSRFRHVPSRPENLPWGISKEVSHSRNSCGLSTPRCGFGIRMGCCWARSGTGYQGVWHPEGRIIRREQAVRNSPFSSKEFNSKIAAPPLQRGKIFPLVDHAH